MDIKRIETLTTSELLSEGQVARLRAREENETQRVLRSAFELLGPNGRNWQQREHRWEINGRYCVIGALGTVIHGNTNYCTSLATSDKHPAAKALHDAAERWPQMVSEYETWPDVAAMFERAITLAATP